MQELQKSQIIQTKHPDIFLSTMFDREHPSFEKRRVVGASCSLLVAVAGCPVCTTRSNQFALFDAPCLILAFMKEVRRDRPIKRWSFNSPLQSKTTIDKL